MASSVKTTAADMDLKAAGSLVTLFTAESNANAQSSAILAEPVTLSRLALKRVIGRSVGNARVFEVKDSLSGHALALKVFPQQRMTPLMMHQVVRGARINAACSALPHVLPLYAAMQDRANVYLLMGMGFKGDLYGFMKAKGRALTPGQACKYVIKPLVTTLEWMHSQGYVHRDIKPENLLMRDDNTVMLCDFDLAINCRDEQPCTQVGTPDYMAPEILKCPHKRDVHDRVAPHLIYSAKADCWAVGVLLWELLTGETPFVANTREGIKRNVMTSKVQLPAWPAKCRSFVSACLQHSYRDRASAEDLSKHEWLSDPMS